MSSAGMGEKGRRRYQLMRELDDAFKGLGFKVYDDIWFKSLDGTRKLSPDLTIVDASKVKEEGDTLVINDPHALIALIETKSEDVHAGALQVLRNYAELSSFGRLKTCFSTNYKSVISIVLEDTLRRIDDEVFGKEITPQTIHETAKFIFDIATGARIAAPIEMKDDTLIRILGASVSNLTPFTKKLPSDRIAYLTGIFFAKTLDPSIMEDASLKKEFEDMAAKAASYLIVNQTFFYHLLSSSDTQYDPLKEITAPQELQKLFDEVLVEDYEPIFGAKLVGLLPAKSTILLNQLISTVKNLKLEHVRRDIIGKVFHSLIPRTMRKRIAAYYTKNTAAELLAELCITKDSDTVLDPTCGSGTFLVAAYNKKKELSATDFSNEELHKKLLKEIYGIDICLFAAHLAAVHLSLQDVLARTEKVFIQVKDFFHASPGTTIMPLEYYFGGKEEIKDKVIVKGAPKLPLTDVILMNPPFTSLERMETKYVNALTTVMDNEGMLKWVGGRGQGLHTYVLLHSHWFLKDGGRLAAVLPQSLLDYVWTTGIKEFISSNYSIDYVISSEAEFTFSEQTDFKDMLVVCRKNRDFQHTKFVMLKVKLSAENVKGITDKIRNTLDNYEDDDIRLRVVPKQQLIETNLWSQFFRYPVIIDKILKISGEKLTEGEKIFGETNVGFEAFGIDFFLLPNKFWDVISVTSQELKIRNNFTTEVLKIPFRFFVKSLGEPDIHTQYVRPKENLYVLTIPAVPKERLPKELVRYIEWAEKFQRKKIPAIRKFGRFWYSHIFQWVQNWQFKRIAILEKFLPTTKGFSAHLVPSDCVGSKTYYFVSTSNSKRDIALTAWFNSSIGLLFRYKYRMILGRGSERILGEHIKKMPCLKVNILSDEEIELLRDCIKEIEKAGPLPSVSKQLGQKYRLNLDKAVLKVLGIEEREAEKILESVYNIIKSWIKEIQSRE